MKTYNFKYGHGSVSLSLNEADILAELHGTETPPISDIRSALFASLEQPIDSAPLRQRVRPGDRVALVISDMTRFWMRQDLVIPHLVDYLIDECGVQPEHLTIVVANGTHIGGDEQELRTLVTDGVYNRVRVKNHDCEAKDLAYLGTTPHETPVWIDRTAAEADLVVCLGAATHHVMAGFGGGRKSILPGISGLETIRHNHAYSLDSTKLRTNPAIGNGVLAGNPLHEDMTEVCAKINPAFLVNMVFSPEGDLHEVVAGHWYKAWEKGCHDLLAMAGVHIKEQADVVIASAGGSPKDINLYQSCKAHMNAVFAVKPGGYLILTLDCPDIKEPAIFTDWFSKSDILSFEKEVRADFSIPAFVAFKTRCIVNSLHTYLVTRPENFEFVRATGQIPVASLEEAWNMVQADLAEKNKKDYTITVMGHASATLPILDK